MSTDRKYNLYRNENGGVVEAHVVTEETEGDVLTVTGGRKVLAGDVVVKSQNEFYADVMDGDDFHAVYSQTTQDEIDEAPSVAQDAPRGSGVRKGYDPSVATAAEVRNYLSNVNSRDEYERVAAAERAGRNRSTAIPERSFED